ncbi:uncharacterized protein LOC108621988 [Ceratina calcarata]|uniref:Uncharacterized protein LOC108621988 n=1 Tax=Ceratina calcarata TaxID=156304 RepID=A0AAJ7W8D3_9HYME|nr:uncharacterized protein LOC108621988 [Ceratina calcarata]XP_026666944.1 uncharacterized protein LOC108621988 [Ceratina calcarata]
MAMVNMNNLLNGKDSRWLQLEVCREFQRNKCTRPDTECKFAHPPANVEVQNGRVTACYDSIKVSLAYIICIYRAERRGGISQEFARRRTGVNTTGRDNAAINTENWQVSGGIAMFPHVGSRNRYGRNEKRRKSRGGVRRGKKKLGRKVGFEPASHLGGQFRVTTLRVERAKSR